MRIGKTGALATGCLLLVLGATMALVIGKRDITVICAGLTDGVWRYIHSQLGQSGHQAVYGNWLAGNTLQIICSHRRADDGG